jgi:hypothetical protein
VKKKEIPVEQPKPDEPTNMEIVTSLGDALKDIESCAQKYGATVLNGKIVIEPNICGFFDVHLKLSFSGVSERIIYSFEALKNLDSHFKTERPIM